MERMKAMQRKLQEDAVEGNITSLLLLLQEDKLVLDRYVVSNYTAETPLHISATLGHLEFTRQILRWKPGFANELDFHKSSPLHLATANGHLEVVKTLLLVNADICLTQDRDGWSPLHIAVIKGRIDVLKELIQAKPQAIQVRGARGETILHLCVKHYQLDALKFLLETVDAIGLVNSGDDDGSTILHLAVADREIEIIRYLITETAIEVNELNANGFTALDIVLAQGRRNIEDVEIHDFLREVGAMSSKEMSSTTPGLQAIRAKKSSPRKSGRRKNWLEEKRNALMVVASLIATMAFQAGISPPNGNWQDNLEGPPSQAHEAGRSIMADKSLDKFANFVGFNTTSFLASITVILLLISGLPFNRTPVFMWALMIIMWIAVMATIFTYTISILVLANRQDGVGTIGVSLVFYGVMGIILAGHSIRLVPRIVKFVRSKRARRPSHSAMRSHANI